ncbi:hypothetical protein F5I97DRAFT_1807672 [Phlebopus sp. FC_14]|nr:hypothetical protein F5I97DRAFT_1807672 [Phlebopus sp. FC_14]
MMAVQPLTLLNSFNVKWSITQEKTINREYPFTDLHLESPDSFVVRTYLQFLWLPESIMPLHLFVPSLRRVRDVPSRPLDVPHPLHALLDPLLLSISSAGAKYHVELRQVLTDNGGAGEAEESMMWFTLNYEKMSGGGEESELGVNNEDAVMMEEKSRNAWLERLERREVQIQILLYCLKLSLPGPCNPLPAVTIAPPIADAVPSSRKKRRKERPKIIIPSPTERLESFMDKLSTWQLLSQMDDAKEPSNTTRDQRDWMQSFCEDIVERQFKSSLPDMCALLRSKVFPQSPFPENENDTDDPSRSPSPPTPPIQSMHSGTSHSKRAPSVQSTSADSIPESRSRSLSVSLAHDASARRSNTTTSTSLKRALSREVSMSRAFKPRVQAVPKETEGPRGAQSQSVATKKANKASQKQSNGSHGVTLVAATPTKRRTNGQAGKYGAGVTRSSSPSLDHEDDEGQSGGDKEEEMWLPDSSPDILLLGTRKRTASSSSSQGELQDEAFGMDTPVKKRKRV